MQGTRVFSQEQVTEGAGEDPGNPRGRWGRAVSEGEAAANHRPSTVAGISSLPFRKSYQRKEGRAEAMNGTREMAGLAKAWEGLNVWVRGATG